MQVITVTFTDENGRDRGARFWCAENSVEYERRRFGDAGYDVSFKGYMWLVAIFETNGEKRAESQWVTAEKVDALCNNLVKRDGEVMIYDAPGRKLLKHVLPEPTKVAEKDTN